MKYFYMKTSRKRKCSGGAFIRPRTKKLIEKDTDDQKKRKEKEERK
jgi:hypothetical protein